MRIDAAVFDIDGTLIPMSLERMLITCMLRRKILTYRELFKRISPLVFSGGGKVRFLRNKFYLKGTSVNEVKELLDGGCWQEIEGRFFQSMLEAIELFRKSGAKIVLLSGTIDILAKYAEGFIRPDHLVSSRLRVKNGVFTGEIEGIYPYRGGKVTVLEDLLKGNGWDREHIWAFGDSHSDFELLSYVGHPVAVNPSSKLEKAARRLKWPVWRVGPRVWNPFAN